MIRKDSATGKEYFTALTATNGLVWPDRKVKPSMVECKKVYQKMVFTYDAITGKLTVKNESNYVPLSDYHFVWMLKENGIEKQKGELPALTALPGELDVQILKPNIQGLQGEVVLEVSARLKEDKLWASNQAHYPRLLNFKK